MSANARIDALTGLRWVAAGVVALAHLPEVTHDPALGRVLTRVLSEGVYGLTFFFMLSGFVLARGYQERLARPTGVALKGYYVARFARVWPLHALTLVVAMLLPVGPWPGGWGEFLANVTLVHAWVPNLEYIQSYNSVSWTLSLEAFFYLACPLLLWGLARWRSAGPIRLGLAAVGVWLAVSAVVLAHASGEGLWPLYVCNVLPLTRAGDFAIGVLLGVASVRAGVVAGPATTTRSRRLWTFVEAAAVVAVLVLILRCHRVPLLYRMNGYYTPAVALLVAVFARQRGALSGLLASRASVFLGEVSYAFYLTHCLVFLYVGSALAPHLGPWARAGVVVPLTLVISAGLFRWVETPMRGRIAGWGRPADVRAPAIAKGRRAA